VSEAEEDEIGLGVTDDLLQFKDYLISSLMTRFTTHSTGKKTQTLSLEGDKTRHIVTVDIFRNEIYLLSAALDPRIKLTPFEGETLLKIVLHVTMQMIV